ncbi:PREDICTED: alpha-lactalbumin-like [Elephantulus edwardii]|uniref:alpha-lactalbumin-like n=1 Tax=Elephantulus edwardii TaxID=28737 RepID=UPI0003F06309|nr:PREDICTED: alpha-lactalbumin-like [Elephantulus edwardii]
MMFSIALLLLGMLFPAIQANQCDKCELAQKLKDMDGYKDISLSEWICIIFHMSGCDPQAKINNNGSTDYGLFQISNKYWCRDDNIPQSSNICNISCNKFLDDDLEDDKMCAKKIVDIKGIDYWLAHKPLCSDKLEQWVCNKL